MGKEKNFEIEFLDIDIDNRYIDIDKLYDDIVNENMTISLSYNGMSKSFTKENTKGDLEKYMSSLICHKNYKNHFDRLERIEKNQKLLDSLTVELFLNDNNSCDEIIEFFINVSKIKSEDVLSININSEGINNKLKKEGYLSFDSVKRIYPEKFKEYKNNIEAMVQNDDDKSFVAQALIGKIYDNLSLFKCIGGVESRCLYTFKERFMEKDKVKELKNAS